MNMRENPASRYWHIHITLPKSEDKNRYHLNRTFGVISLTAEDAIAQVKLAYPGVTIWSVQHRGSVDFGIVERDGGYHESDLPK